MPLHAPAYGLAPTKRLGKVRPTREESEREPGDDLREPGPGVWPLRRAKCHRGGERRPVAPAKTPCLKVTTSRVFSSLHRHSESRGGADRLSPERPQAVCRPTGQELSSIFVCGKRGSRWRSVRQASIASAGARAPKALVSRGSRERRKGAQPR
jgi:hypothetical protein